MKTMFPKLLAKHGRSARYSELEKLDLELQDQEGLELEL